MYIYTPILRILIGLVCRDLFCGYSLDLSGDLYLVGTHWSCLLGYSLDLA